MIGGIAIGLLCVAVFFAGGHPWSVTFAYTVWGAKAATALGLDLSHSAFWQWPGPKRALTDSVLSDTSSLTDFGMLFGAMAAAAATKPFAATAWPPVKSLLAAGIGGLLMGWGARLGFGCNIGGLRRGRCFRIATRLDLAPRCASRLPARHPLAAAFRPLEGIVDAHRLYRCGGPRRCSHSGRPPLQSLEWSCDVARGFRGRVRALRRAVSVEEIVRSVLFEKRFDFGARRRP